MDESPHPGEILMIDKKQLGKKVIYQKEVWKIEKIISPSKYEDYLLLSMEGENAFDSKTVETYMLLIDCHDEEFCPYNNKTKKLIEEIEKLRVKRAKLEKSLSEIWLDCVCND